jgi:hypothetical protein
MGDMSQLGQQLKPLFAFLDTLLGKDRRHFDVEMV